MLDSVAVRCEPGVEERLLAGADLVAEARREEAVVRRERRGRVLNAEKAAEIVSLLDPRIVIPMLYKTDASREDFQPIDRFIKEMGSEAKTPEQRLNINRSGLPHDTTLVQLNYRGG